MNDFDTIMVTMKMERRLGELKSKSKRDPQAAAAYEALMWKYKQLLRSQGIKTKG